MRAHVTKFSGASVFFESDARLQSPHLRRRVYGTTCNNSRVSFLSAAKDRLTSLHIVLFDLIT